jgi:amino acid permease
MEPLKRIGEEVQFKKLKGNYLYYFFGVICILIILVTIIISIEVPNLFKMVTIVIVCLGVYQILKSFQKKSMEDFYIDIRKRCKKVELQIQGELINEIPHD